MVAFYASFLLPMSELYSMPACCVAQPPCQLGGGASWQCSGLGTQDLQECVDVLQKDSTGIKDGMAPIYGLASVSPDRKIIGEFLVAYQDVLLSG